MRAVGDNDRIVAVDFEASSFLPMSFFPMALNHPDSFTRLIRKFVERPESTQTASIELASSLLVKYQSNRIGESHIPLSCFLSFFPSFYFSLSR